MVVSFKYQFLMFASDKPGKVTVGSQTLTLAGKNGVYRARSGGGNPGTLVTSTVPVWAMAEAQNTNDEQVLYGDFRTTTANPLLFSAACNHISATAHTCSCGAGFFGDGKTTGTGCSDINACATQPCPTRMGTTPVFVVQNTPEYEYFSLKYT